MAFSPWNLEVLWMLKALLFLGAGLVIHHLAGEQDIRRMGGLRRYLPQTYVMFLVGSLALVGVTILTFFVRGVDKGNHEPNSKIRRAIHFPPCNRPLNLLSSTKSLIPAGHAGLVPIAHVKAFGKPVSSPHAGPTRHVCRMRR